MGVPAWAEAGGRAGRCSQDGGGGMPGLPGWLRGLSAVNQTGFASEAQ